MNKFEYETQLSEIKNAKTLKKLEEIIRANLLYNGRIPQVGKYKLATLAYKKFVGKSSRELPIFIERRLRNMQESLSEILKINKCSLEEFLDTFEYDSSIHFGYNTDFVEYYQSIVKDTELPFSIDTNEHLTAFETYAFSTSTVDKCLLKLVKHIRLKQVYGNKKNYLLDLDVFNSKEQIRFLLPDTHIKYLKELEDSEVLLKQHLKAIKTTKEYIKGLINESNNNNTEEFKSANGK